MPLSGVDDMSDLFASGANTKKGLMKSGGAWQVGPSRVVEAMHANGGAPIKIQLQVNGESSLCPYVACKIF